LWTLTDGRAGRQESLIFIAAAGGLFGDLTPVPAILPQPTGGAVRHAAMISRPPPRHHWFTDSMTSERRHIIRVVAALAGLFFVVAVVLMASAP
jgi:hypothetical protein